MTLEELSALINDAVEVCEPDCAKHQQTNSPWLALRAVVELHSAYFGLCKTCTTLNKHIAYPCLTIQAVEKELA